jgi:hypothetical protein
MNLVHIFFTKLSSNPSKYLLVQNKQELFVCIHEHESYLDVKHIKIKQGLSLTFLYMYEQPNALCLNYCILAY